MPSEKVFILPGMKRIMVIGCCGSGKSTFSRKLHQITGLPLFHLDQYYWKPNWTETPKDEWRPIVANLAAKKEWIIDGNYGGTLDIRIKNADTIIYMDIPTITCLGRVIKRVWTHHGKVRPDMPEGCKERFDLDFLHYVATYNLIRRKGLLKKMDEVKSDKTIFTIKNNSDIDLVLSHFSEEVIQKSSLEK